MRAAEKRIPPPAEANTAWLKANWDFGQGVNYLEGNGVAQNLEIAENTLSPHSRAIRKTPP